MEELEPQELEDLVQELEGEYEPQESVLQEVEELVRVLETGSHYLGREAAAELLGNVGSSSARIVQALLITRDCDPSSEVRKAATTALSAPVHQEQLRRQPDAETVKRAVEDEEAEHLLDVLASGRPYVARQVAAEQLG